MPISYEFVALAGLLALVGDSKYRIWYAVRGRRYRLGNGQVLAKATALQSCELGYKVQYICAVQYSLYNSVGNYKIGGCYAL